MNFTHPDKVLFPRAKLTKLDLARHYERVAPVMLPYVKDRPLALQAYPGGIDGKGFFMKAVPDYFPDWVAARDGAQARRHRHARAGRRRRHAGVPGRARTWSRRTCGSRAPTSRSSPTG